MVFRLKMAFSVPLNSMDLYLRGIYKYIHSRYEHFMIYNRIYIGIHIGIKLF